jgi:hypothetical protein
MALLNFSGQLTMLRVHDVGSKFGPTTDQIDVEVVFKLSSQPQKAFGFTLRNDTNEEAHQGMLALLRSGFDHDWVVHTDAEIASGKNNGKSIRVWLTKPPSGAGTVANEPRARQSGRQ